MSADHRLTDTEDLWWDFVIPNDLAAAVGDDLAGRWLTAIFMAFCNQYTGGVRVIQDTLRGAPANVLPLAATLVPYFSGAPAERRSPRPVRHLHAASGESEDLRRPGRGLPRQHRALSLCVSAQPEIGW